MKFLILFVAMAALFSSVALAGPGKPSKNPKQGKGQGV
jgi:hypothetical protein